MGLLDELHAAHQHREAEQRRHIQLVDLHRVIDHLADDEVLVYRTVAERDPAMGHPGVVTSHRPFSVPRDLLQVPQC
eukprot:9685477-Heterocapsa_arctica.AAC.1